MAVDEVMTLENLEYYKEKQDAFNNEKFAAKSSIPVNVSQLVNDAEYQTKQNLDTAISSVAEKLTKISGGHGAPVLGGTVGDLYIDYDTGDIYEFGYDENE